jgi:FKBP-type peptidyl-prolyl cis-trans isomerase
MTLKWIAAVGVVAVAAAVTVFAGARAKGGGAPGLTTQTDRVSYGLGATMAANFKRQGVKVDPDVVARGLRDALAGKALLMSEQEIVAAMNALKVEVKQSQAVTSKAAADARRKTGEEFLAENAKKDGVVTLSSGLQYKVLKAGDGKAPTDADTVTCNYRGTLLDGTEFDSSERRGKAATFTLTKVIAGLKEAFKLMPEGSRWQVFVPPQLAYGARGAGPTIAPNSTLVFDVELLAVNTSQAAAESASPVRLARRARGK